MTHDLTHIHTHTIYTYTQTTHATHPPKLTKQVGNKTKASSDLFSFAGYSSDPAPAPQLGTNKGEAQGGSGWDCPPPPPRLWEVSFWAHRDDVKWLLCAQSHPQTALAGHSPRLRRPPESGAQMPSLPLPASLGGQTWPVHLWPSGSKHETLLGFEPEERLGTVMGDPLLHRAPPTLSTRVSRLLLEEGPQPGHLLWPTQEAKPRLLHASACSFVLPPAPRGTFPGYPAGPSTRRSVPWSRAAQPSPAQLEAST